MNSSMFHSGDLNSGITRAIQEGKVVACFVRSDSDEWSEIWEDYWLANKSQPTDMISSDHPPLGLLIADKAVLLRLEFGGKEAGFLSAFCPIEKCPTLVIIHNGNVLDKLEAGLAREDFEERLMKAVGLDEEPATRQRQRQPEVFFDQDDDEDLLVHNGGEDQVSPETQTREDETSSSSQPQPIPQSTSNVQTLLSERGQRLEAERLRREAAEKAERIARMNGRRKEAEEAAAATGQADKGKQRATTASEEKQKARDQWIYQQKQRKDEAKKDRERILAQIENDKQERKAQAQRRREAESLAGGGAYSEMGSSTTVKPSPGTNPSPRSHCMLVIRLFDGTSIRGKFASDADVATAVRTWVQEASPAGGADIPYNFRQILAPNPSRTIEVSEEHQSLQELGLVPNATLVLVPISGATSAYATTGGWSVTNAAHYLANTAYGLLGSVWSYVPSIGNSGNGPYLGGTGDEQEQSNLAGAHMAGSDSASPGGGSTKIRVKTMADQHRAEDEKAKRAAEFYNGNSSAFEGRKDDDGDGK